MSLLLAVLLLAAPPPPEKIIDMHLHAYEKDERWTARVPNPATGRKMTATDEASHRAATFAAMKRARVVKAVVSADDFAAVLRWKRAAPDTVIAGYGFNDPGAVDFAFLRAEHAAGRLE